MPITDETQSTDGFSEDGFSGDISIAQARIADLRLRAQQSPPAVRGLLPDAIAELNTAVEELRVAEEEMRAQNEELIRTRQRVEAERQRYQDLFEFAPDGYLLTTPDGKILESNQAASRLLNIAPRFLKNRPLAGSVYEDDLRDFHTRMAALRAAGVGGPQEWTLRLRRRQVGPFLASLTVSAMPAPLVPRAGEAATLRWIVRDVTGRRLAEEERLALALARAQAAQAEAEAGRKRTEAVLDTVSDAFISLDADMRFTYLNASAARNCRIAGVDPVALLGRVLEDDFPTVIGRRMAQEARRVLETGQASEFEGYSDGLNCWLLVRFFPAVGGGVVAYYQDITARKEAEAGREALYERERRIAETLQQTLLRSAPSGAFSPLEVETFYEAAWDEAQIGGDFFDVFRVGSDRAALVVGDVSGKGLAAAEMTAQIKYALRVLLREAAGPGVALARLNDFLCASQESGDAGTDHQVALTLTTVVTATGETVSASAGGEPALFLGTDGSQASAWTEGLLLGIQPGIVYTEHRARLCAGDVVLLVTDGITEARREGAWLGPEGLSALLARVRADEPLRETGQAVLDGARDWAGGELQDDVCLLLARWGG